ncbi:S41 family peptidase [Parablautia intestinalis]|uniref:S41 family peptidase n=1 Tax=Parablautia intestinalis TaxID=2320100 RepID=UPI00256EDB5C|nr:S41 family peptidase [Parablautia intestinalis]
MDKSDETDSRTWDQEEAGKESEKKRRSRDFLRELITGMLIISLFFACVCTGGVLYRLYKARAVGVSAQGGRESVVTNDTLEKMKVIEDAVSTYYYYEDKVDAEEMREGIYKGMIDSLGDPYSEYYSKEELEEAINSNQGISYGIGAYISMSKQMNMAMINGVMEGSPAEEAGLREGDIIYEVDGEATQGMSLTQVVSLVKGREGTTVQLTIYREGEVDFQRLEIKRSKRLETTTVDSGMLEDADNIGYLRIREFDTVTVDQYTEAMAELRGHGMEGMILDLRSNPGGDVNAVVEIARKILPEGLIVYTEDKQGVRKEYTCDGKKELDVPLVVLVNEYSASASEILAGAIQDYHKGTLVGTTTYGKGIVQQIQRLDDGTALKLTISAYYTPAGRNIHGVGIKPDVELEYDYEGNEETGSDNQVERAIEILNDEISVENN